MATNINVDTSQFRDRVQKLRDGIPELIHPKLIGNDLVKRMRQRFTTKVAPDGTAWAKRSPKTKAGGSLLLVTSRLRKAIQVINGNPPGYASNTGLGFRAGLVSKPYVEPGRAKPVDPMVYGRAHQMGEDGQKRRRFIGLSDLDRAWALRRIQAHAASLVK